MAIGTYTQKDLERLIEHDQNMQEFEPYQRELVRMLEYIQDTKRKVIALIEGRDTAGKGNLIRYIMEYLSPRNTRTVALNKPTEDELMQWYFQRYVTQLPTPGEFVMFDRSWYNRAMVEPVMGFCSKEQYESFMSFVTHFERSLISDHSTDLFKIYLSVDKQVQKERIEERKSDILTSWKCSPVDAKAQEKWGENTYAKLEMLEKTHHDDIPWHVVDSNYRPETRIEVAKILLNQIFPEGERNKDLDLTPNSNIVRPGNMEVENMKKQGKTGKSFKWKDDS